MSYRKPPLPPDRRPPPLRRLPGDQQPQQPQQPQQQPQVQTPPPWLLSFDDPMDIDSEPGVPRQAMPRGPTAMEPPSRPAEGGTISITTDGTKIWRHIFEIDISSHDSGLGDLEVLEHARTQLGFLERSGLRDDAMRRIRDCRTRLRVVIDTKSPSRLDALADARLRMLTMQDMINEGMGWFPGLPWRHNHFRVEVFHPRA